MLPALRVDEASMTFGELTLYSMISGAVVSLVKHMGPSTGPPHYQSLWWSSPF